MTISEYEFYCLSHNNPIKKKRMEERFQELNIDCLFYDGLNKDDIRINGYNINKFLKRKWSITYSHLDIIKQFYINSDKKYAVICEDDICIHKNIKYILNKITSDFNILNLDILLLGYMLPYKIDNEHISMNYKLKANINVKSSFKYHEYPEYLSGCQMYMISRNYAHYLLTTYSASKINLLLTTSTTPPVISTVNTLLDASTTTRLLSFLDDFNEVLKVFKVELTHRGLCLFASWRA
jgi:GR25 family glycosyltransferase involved in LPS biosynthesis